MHAYSCACVCTCVCVHVRACACPLWRWRTPSHREQARRSSLPLRRVQGSPACVCMLMRAYACTCMRMHAYACVCLRMHTCACVCMCVRAYACVSGLRGWEAHGAQDTGYKAQGICMRVRPPRVGGSRGSRGGAAATGRQRSSGASHLSEGEGVGVGEGEGEGEGEGVAHAVRWAA